MEEKPFEEIREKIRLLEFSESFDVVVGIAKGGIVPAVLLSEKLGIPLGLLWMSLRDDKNNQVFDFPRLLRPPDFCWEGKSVLIADDRCRTGKTFKAAKEVLRGARLLRTFAVNGRADYALYSEPCFLFPWKNMQGKKTP